MKKLLILFLTITSLALTAQTKQNDATWEETIEFLKEQLNGFEIMESRKLVNYYGSNGDYYYRSKWWISDNEIKLTITAPNNKRYKEIILAKLSNIKSANYTEKYNKGIEIIFLKNAVKTSLSGMTQPYSSKMTVGFCTNSLYKEKSYKCNSALYQRNDSFTTRTLKAFKHLAYLANQKRKKSKF